MAEDRAEDISRKRTPSLSSSQKPNKKVKLVSRKRRAGFDEEMFRETTYYIKDGLRHVKPYYFTFTTHAKGRWVGSTVYDVFCKEFQAESPQYYERAIKAGKVTVNGGKAVMETVICHNDLICHLVHRHEPPVTAQPLAILHKDEELLVVDKPPSIPIHPCGRYRHNTVVFLLGREHHLKNLHTVHRLDRLTSGLLILARSVPRAQQLEVEIRGHKVTKEYVCRVEGEFPSSPIECDQPILVFSHKLGLSRVDPEGKPCTTLFTRLSYNGRTSVVKCQPKTGRMHQIRVHLQWLGHPILNDPLYNHPAWRRGTGEEQPRGEAGRGKGDAGIGGDTEKTKAGTNLERIVAEIMRRNIAKSEISQATGDEDTGEGYALIEEHPSSTAQESPPHTSSGDSNGGNLSTERTQQGRHPSDPHPLSPTNDLPQLLSDVVHDPDCTECSLTRPTPSQEELFIYLHALSYKGDGWSFATPTPPWADANWTQQPSGLKIAPTLSTQPATKN